MLLWPAFCYVTAVGLLLLVISVIENVLFLVINHELLRRKCNEIAALSGKDGEEERKWVKGASRGGNCGG